MSFLAVTDVCSIPYDASFAVKNISFTQQAMEHVAIIGETGSGKSTLLKMIGGLLQPQSGSIIFQNNIVRGPDWQLIPGEKGMAYLSQHYELRNNYKMEELLAYANEMSDDEAATLFKICRIDHLLKRNSYQLSGGEKQRIALARLLVSKPTLLLLDEPYSNLDLIHTNILKQVVTDVCKQYNITTIITSHDPADILPWADKVVVLQKGSLVQIDHPTHLYNNPNNEYAAALLGAYNYYENEAAALIAATLGLHLQKKDLLIRPEKIAIQKATDTAANAFVKTVQFYGHYYIVTVSINGLTMQCFTTQGNFILGENVKVAAINNGAL
ncbi:ABC transporter ATP-binding protein [Ferruginibacter yonginensis]|uniref:ABC transporter ATP-binding protein n=1 Tax=Ferruginibacter yonginensis TaxID=1310416 RepID=A0ABV8QLZ2_9BACT